MDSNGHIAQHHDHNVRWHASKTRTDSKPSYINSDRLPKPAATAFGLHFGREIRTLPLPPQWERPIGTGRCYTTKATDLKSWRWRFQCIASSACRRQLPNRLYKQRHRGSVYKYRRSIKRITNFSYVEAGSRRTGNRVTHGDAVLLIRGRFPVLK